MVICDAKLWIVIFLHVSTRLTQSIRLSEMKSLPLFSMLDQNLLKALL